MSLFHKYEDVSVIKACYYKSTHLLSFLLSLSLLFESYISYRCEIKPVATITRFCVPSAAECARVHEYFVTLGDSRQREYVSVSNIL